jgi:hypothetical protein
MCRSVLLYFLAIFLIFGITDARFFFPDLPADTWQLHNGCVSGLLGPAQEALNSRSACAKVSSDSFTSTLCGYLRSNHSFVKDVKQDRRRKSVSNGSVETAHKEKNRLKKITRRRGSTPQDRRTRMQHSRNGRTCATFMIMQRKPLLELLGVWVIYPSFSVGVANGYYPENYQVLVRLQQGYLSWFPYLPEDKFGHAFDP